jgi:hypothetical protein
MADENEIGSAASGVLGTAGAIASVIPGGQVVGAILGGLGAFGGGLFGQSAKNDAARREAELATQRVKANRAYQMKILRRDRRFFNEGINIQRQNIEAEYAYRDQTALDSWRYQMGIRAFDYNQEKRAYALRQQTALQQLNFNNIALDFSLQDTARWEQEQNLQLDFQEKSTMMEFQYAQRGLQLDFVAADVARQQSGAAGQADQQAAYIQGLKQAGEAQARTGMGVGGEKAAAAAIAETGLITSQIIQNVMNAEQNFGLTSSQIGMKLEQLNDTFYLSKAQLAASRLSLGMQGMAMRRDAAIQKFQADLNAITSIGLSPAIPPALPKPQPLPRPELQKAPKVIPLPKVTPYQAATVNPFLAGLSAAAPSIGKAVVAGVGNNINPPAGNVPGTTNLGNLPASSTTNLNSDIG